MTFRSAATFQYRVKIEAMFYMEAADVRYSMQASCER
jgi:hypothetical protein